MTPMIIVVRGCAKVHRQVFEFRVDYGDAVKLPIHKVVPSSVRAISHPALESGDIQFRGLRDCYREFRTFRRMAISWNRHIIPLSHS